MLTRLRVRGFKNLLDVDVRFGPFTCFVGENGAGKSNLFDVINFLRLLMDAPVHEAFARTREVQGRAADVNSMFTSFGDFRAPEVRITADMLLEREVEDDFGTGASACISSVRYEIAFRPDEDQPAGVVLDHESLQPTRIAEARQLGFDASSDFKTSAVSGRRAGGPFLSTKDGAAHVHQEGHQGRGRQVPLTRTSRPIIQSATAEFPTLLAARREMQGWKTLMLEPTAMRAPSEYAGPQRIDQRGAHLAGALQRLHKGAGAAAYSEIANRLAELLPEVREVRVVDDPRFQTYTVQVRGPDGTFHPARALSDGTLRFLVLTTLLEDPEARGTLCLEEPENGIHPDRVRPMVRLLRDFAVDPARPVDGDNPLRQVVVNTHSPLVFKEVDSSDVVFLESAERAEGRGHVAIVEAPGGSWRAKYTRHVRPARLRQWEQIEFDFEADAAEE
ncbi:MAG: AAA family ATPase [Proteobacteria bacterium]|nr:AAA family ATPase [Pseudomonadota bacterium]